MIRLVASLMLLCAASLTPAAAQDLRSLGHGRLINNDLIGDGKDRWHTGSASFSRVYGPSWGGMLPDAPGQLLEFRLDSGIVAPSNLADPADDDRPFAGYLTFGLHTHFRQGAYDLSVGGGLTIVGPQTGLDDFQTAVHDTLSMRSLSDDARDNQISDTITLGFVAEAGRTIEIGDRLALRPFGEVRLGPETLLRAGADLALGRAGQDELLIRERVTGQRYRTITNSLSGASLVLGGDMAFVDSSLFLPEDRGLDLTDSRSRLRAGVHWQGQYGAAFYGLTYLSEEFDAQDEGQIVGSIRLQLEF